MRKDAKRPPFFMANQATLIEIYLCSGKLGSGKNHISEQILLPMLPPKPTLFLGFANHFKIESIVKDGLDREKVFGDKDDVTRIALQRRGTEEGRDVYGENIWVDFGLEWLYTYLTLGFTRYIFTDGRFPNEVALVTDLDGREMTVLGKTYLFSVTSIRALAPQRSLARASAEARKNDLPVEKITGHLSETALDDYRGFTYVVDNDYDDDVYPRMKAIARELTERHAPELCYVVDLDDTLCHCGVYYEAVIQRAGQALYGLLDQETAMTGQDFEHFKRAMGEAFEKERQVIYAATHVKRVFRREAFAEEISLAFERTAHQFGFSGLGVQTTKDEIYEMGMHVFEQPYHAFDGALEALAGLQKLGLVVLYTHGDRIEQVAKVARLGLSRLPLVIAPNKGDDSLAHLMAAYPAKKYVVVGDNYTRDVMPAVAAGAERVYWISQAGETTNMDPNYVNSRGALVVKTIQEVLRNELFLNTLTGPAPSEMHAVKGRRFEPALLGKRRAEILAKWHEWGEFGFLRAKTGATSPGDVAPGELPLPVSM